METSAGWYSASAWGPWLPQTESPHTERGTTSMTTIANAKEAMMQAPPGMEKAVEDFRHARATVRPGRANIALLDGVRVDYHGTPMPINQLGTMTVPDASLIVIQPWDPTAASLIDKA